MDQKILKQFENILNKALANVVTKDDARQFLTKDDAKQFLTKDDAKKFATKDDLKNFLTKEDAKNFATKDDLKNFATKDDLNRFATKDELFERFDKIDKMQMAIVESTDDVKEDKITVTKLEKRVDKLEEKVFA